MTIALKAGAMLLFALVLQSAVVSHLTVFGVRGDVLLLVPISAALTMGPDRGAIAGFVAGFAVDLLVTTPFGLTALSFCLAGYCLGVLQTGMIRDAWWFPPLAAAGTAAFAVVTWAITASVVGESGLLNGHFITIVVVEATVAALLIIPALRIAEWVESDMARPLPGIRDRRAR